MLIRFWLCVQTIRINPTWSKGYVRKGAALHGATRWDEAIAAYEAGLKIEDSDALRKGLQSVRDAKGKLASHTHLYITATRMLIVVRCVEMESDGGMGGALGLGKMFSDPSIWAKLAGNPKTAPLLADPSFTQKVRVFPAYLNLRTPSLTPSPAPPNPAKPPPRRYSAPRPADDHRDGCPAGDRYARVREGGGVR